MWIKILKAEFKDADDVKFELVRQIVDQILDGSARNRVDVEAEVIKDGIHFVCEGDVEVSFFLPGGDVCRDLQLEYFDYDLFINVYSDEGDEIDALLTDSDGYIITGDTIGLEVEKRLK